MMKRLKIAGILVLALTATAGCGSTAHLDAVANGGSASVAGDGLGLTDGTSLTTAPESAPSQQAGPAADSPDAVGSPDDGVAAEGSGSSAPGTGGVSTPVAQTSGRGFTASTISIGILTENDASTIGGASGLNGLDFGDLRSISNALIADVNSRGGIFGRKLVAVFHDVSTVSTVTNPANAAAAACADFTQDHKVFVVFSELAVINKQVDAFLGCMHKAQTPVVISDAASHSAKSLASLAPDIYMPGVITTDRYVPPLINRLESQGFFSGWDTTTGAAGNSPVKIGVLTSDDVESKVLYSAITKALKAHGRSVAVTVSAPMGSAGGSAMNSAVLRMRSAGVTHMFGVSPYFLTAANQQKYKPRYAISSITAPEVTGENASSGQLNGAMGIGWIPAVDVALKQDPGDVSSAVGRCYSIMKKSGNQPASRVGAYVVQIACEAFNLIEAATKAAPVMSSNALALGYGKVGAKLKPVVTFSEKLVAGRPDTGAAVRDLGYDTSCSCFAYRSKTNIAVP